MRARKLGFVLAVSLLNPLLSSPAVAQTQDLSAYARAVDEHPEDAKAYEAFATAAIQARQFDDAIGRLKIGVARIPDFRRAYYLMAFAYRSKQAWADAAGFYRVCIAVKQQELEAYFGLGKALAGMGDAKGATAAFRMYVDNEKDPAKTRFVDAARAEIAKLEPPVAAATGGDAAALKAEADGLKNAGRFEEAIAAYKRAINVDPNNQDLHNDLGNAYFALKRYNEAAASFKDATSRAPDYAIGWYNLANALRKAGKPEAVEAYKRYMALQPTDPDPYFGMAQSLKAMGDTQQAIKAYHRYLEMETRPEQQKWREKATAELQALEGATKAATPAGGGKIGFD